jgi:hypothetical protein
MQYNLNKPIVEIIHVGDGKYNALLENGELDEVNKGITDLINFIYFENSQYPTTEWKKKLEIIHDDYMNRIDEVKKHVK